MQGLLKLGQSREDKLRRVTLNVDEADINFALQVWVKFLEVIPLQRSILC